MCWSTENMKFCCDFVILCLCGKGPGDTPSTATGPVISTKPFLSLLSNPNSFYLNEVKGISVSTLVFCKKKLKMGSIRTNRLQKWKNSQYHSEEEELWS